MKQGIMGLTLGAVMLFIGYGLFSQALYAASLPPDRFPGCAPHQTMFFAYTANHTKAVEFCEVADGYRYTYGPIQAPELQITKRPGEIGRFPSKSGWGFAMKNDNLLYYISIDRDTTTLVVSRGDGYSGSPLARIPLERHGWGAVSKAAQTRYIDFAY